MSDSNDQPVELVKVDGLLLLVRKGAFRMMRLALMSGSSSLCVEFPNLSLE